MFELDGKIMCFCNMLSTHKNNENSEHIKGHTYKNCIYPFCEQSKQFCYLNEKCVDGKCVCIDGYSRNPMSSLCEKNNECVLNSKDVCKDPGMCVLADNRYVCLCPFPYVRVLKDCLHPMTAIKMKLIIFSNFKNDFSNDENDAFKKENFYINVFGSMPQYIKEAINSVRYPLVKIAYVQGKNTRIIYALRSVYKMYYHFNNKSIIIYMHKMSYVVHYIYIYIYIFSFR